MPPWCGVEESEVAKKVANGEILPVLQDSTPSLISYLTQYGLKWNDHERELDLQEVHTMLKSLKVNLYMQGFFQLQLFFRPYFSC